MTSTTSLAAAIVARAIRLIANLPAAFVAYVAGLGLLGLLIDLSDRSLLLVQLLFDFIAGYLLTRLVLRRSGPGISAEHRVGGFFAISFLSGLGTIFGLLALVVPGIIMFLRWLPATSILLAEDVTAVQALDRSWHRTRGHFWSLLIACLPYLCLQGIGLAGLALAAQMADAPFVFVLSISNLATELASAFLISLSVSAYLSVDPDPKRSLKDVFA